MAEESFARYPLVAQSPHARSWLTFLANLQRSPHTVDAYARDLQDYFAFCDRQQVVPEAAQRDHIARYVGDMAARARPQRAEGSGADAQAGLANATMQRRLTALRLFYDYLVEEAWCVRNPVSRGRYTPGRGFAGARDRGLLRRYVRLPWIPNAEQWTAILEAVQHEPFRNRFMFALAYDAGLRREELCSLATTDIEPGKRLVHLRAETTKNQKARVVPFSAATGQLLAAYLVERRALGRSRGPLFLSVSRRNWAQPLSKWAWSKIIRQIAVRAATPALTPHTLRHLCLTDLASAGWDLREIADFAGHTSVETTRMYIRLSGRELAKKLDAGMASVHHWRAQVMGEVFQ